MHTSNQTVISRAVCSSRHPLFATFISVLIAGTFTTIVRGQASAPKDDVLTLSPFEVKSDPNEGIISRNAVSATRFNVPIDSLPFTINVLTGQLFEDVEAFDIRDVIKYAGITSSGSSQFNYSTTNTFRIRGFETAFSLKNGFRTTGNVSIVPAAVERVEVVKGPASLLYGQIPPGGTVNVITKRPREVAEHSVKLQVGSYEWYRGDIDLTGPLGKGFAYRLLVSAEDSKSELVFQQRRQFTLNPMLDWRTSDGRLKIHTEAVYQTSDDIAVSSGVPIDGDVAKQIVLPDGQIGITFPYHYPARDYNSRDLSSYFDTIIKGGETTAEAKISDRLTARLAVSYRDTESEGINEATGYTVNLSLPSTSPSYGVLPITNYDQSIAKFKELEAQFNLLTDFEAKWVKGMLLAGVDYRKSEGDQFLIRAREPNPANPSQLIFFQRTANIFNRATWNRPSPGEINYRLPSLGGYGSLRTDSFNVGTVTSGYVSAMTSALDERIRFTYGVRYDQYESDNQNFVTTPATVTLSEGQWTTQQAGILIGLVKDKTGPLRNLGIYGNVSEAFQPVLGRLRGPDPDGNVLDVDTNNDGVPDQPNLADNVLYAGKPIVGEGHEIGLKSEWFNGRVILSANYFKVDNTNIVRTILVNHPLNNTLRLDQYEIQSGLERAEGYEAELLANLTKNWQAQVNWVQTDARLVSDDSMPVANGRLLPDVPPYCVRVFSRYAFTEGRLKGLTFGGGLDWTDTYYGSGAPQDTNPRQHQEFRARTLVEVFVSHRFKVGKIEYRAQLNVKNLTNVYGVDGGWFGGTLRPRNYMFTLDARF